MLQMIIDDDPFFCSRQQFQMALFRSCLLLKVFTGSHCHCVVLELTRATRFLEIWNFNTLTQSELLILCTNRCLWLESIVIASGGLVIVVDLRKHEQSSVNTTEDRSVSIIMRFAQAELSHSPPVAHVVVTVEAVKPVVPVVYDPAGRERTLEGIAEERRWTKRTIGKILVIS